MVEHGVLIFAPTRSITLKTFEDELILAVGSRHLRLVRLLDRGSVQDALLRWAGETVIKDGSLVPR